MAYVSELRSRPAVADLLGEAVITEQLRGTAALPTFPRMSSGPGWAIGGDRNTGLCPFGRCLLAGAAPARLARVPLVLTSRAAHRIRPTLLEVQHPAQVRLISVPVPGAGGLC
jgi:hypothetical protein